ADETRQSPQLPGKGYQENHQARPVAVCGPGNWRNLCWLLLPDPRTYRGSVYPAGQWLGLFLGCVLYCGHIPKRRLDACAGMPEYGPQCTNPVGIVRSQYKRGDVRSEPG